MATERAHRVDRHERIKRHFTGSLPDRRNSGITAPENFTAFSDCATRGFADVCGQPRLAARIPRHADTAKAGTCSDTCIFRKRMIAI